MTSIAQRIREIIRLSTTIFTCSYKHTEGEIWPAIPQERERFTTSNEFMKLDLKIFDSLLKTNTISARVENQIVIEDAVPMIIEQPVSVGDADSDDSIADPTYQSQDFFISGDDDFDNDIVMTDHFSDNDEAEPTNEKGKLIIIIIITMNYYYFLRHDVNR